jgi:hypothetical protein
MSLVSYSFTQPYFEYIEGLAYNVIPGTVTLTFDSSASTDPADYRVRAIGGILDSDFDIGFTVLQPNPTLAVSGLTATLTVPVTMDSNCYMSFYYQGSILNFQIRANEDTTYETPAIFEGLPYLN